MCLAQPRRSSPLHVAYNSQSELLLIATQTCSLVGPSAEAAFEVIVATPLPNFNPEGVKHVGRKSNILTYPSPRVGASASI